jgi:hypothetical protein
MQDYRGREHTSIPRMRSFRDVSLSSLTYNRG